jgi:hypothetical protein
LTAAVVLPVVELNLPPPPPPPPPEADVDPLLLPNGVLWEEIEGVNIEKHPHKFGRKSTIHMPRTRVDRVEKVEDYFNAMFPLQEVDKIVAGTNLALAAKNKNLTCKGEILKYLGIRLASVLERRRGSVRSWFAEGHVPRWALVLHVPGA